MPPHWTGQDGRACSALAGLSKRRRTQCATHRRPRCQAGSAPEAPECLSTQQVKSLQTLGGAAVSHKTNSCPPLVQPCHWRLSQGKELGVDDGKHGLTTPVTVPQGAVQQLQETSG